jgi:hypothetical protein
MKASLIAISLLYVTFSFAGTTSCRSKDYEILVYQDGLANYSVRGRLNDGADVEVSNFYKTTNVLAIGLTVDGFQNRFEVSAARSAQNMFKGMLFFGSIRQSVTCESK